MAFSAVYQEGDPGHGIGGYDLQSAADQAFAYDYDGSGKLDHIALYRPGTGTMWILKNVGGAFSPVYQEGDPGHGIGGYDLQSAADQAFAYDYDGSGKLDHIALYRPGTGTMWILKNVGGAFSPVYQEGDPGRGIGGYDLQSAADQAFAYDYDGSGKLDHIALYRPGTGTMWILKNVGGAFSPVYQEGDPGHGIGGYDLQSAADQAFAYDYDGSGKLDHIALYRPGTGTMWILKNVGGAFSPVYQEGDPGHGIGGYDLQSAADQAFAYDYDGSGKLDHIALYRPGTGTMWILKNVGGAFSPVYQEGDPGHGIGGYDLQSAADQAFAYDYDGSGKLDHIALYRPGTGTMWILKNSLIARPAYARRDVWTLSAPWDPITEAYARAVAVMQARRATDPTSWAYQAAIHGSYQPVPPGAQWNLCQHQSWYFFPWHRMYLYYFERIVRAAAVSVGGPADFALPYWNYDRPFPANTLPSAFRQATLPDGSPNPLFLPPPRRAGSIAGGAQLSPLVTSSSAAMAMLNFTGSTGSTSFGGGTRTPSHFGGSTGALEQQPHNVIHVQVGGGASGSCGGGLMSDPNCAALDPIFWLHHANVDRLWNQWLALGGGRADPVDAAWLNQSFTFYDETGAAVSLNGADVLDSAVQLGYVYV